MLSAALTGAIALITSQVGTASGNTTRVLVGLVVTSTLVAAWTPALPADADIEARGGAGGAKAAGRWPLRLLARLRRPGGDFPPLPRGVVAGMLLGGPAMLLFSLTALVPDPLGAAMDQRAAWQLHPSKALGLLRAEIRESQHFGWDDVADELIPDSAALLRLRFSGGDGELLRVRPGPNVLLRGAFVNHELVASNAVQEGFAAAPAGTEVVVAITSQGRDLPDVIETQVEVERQGPDGEWRRHRLPLRFDATVDHAERRSRGYMVGWRRFLTDRDYGATDSISGGDRPPDGAQPVINRRETTASAWGDHRQMVRLYYAPGSTASFISSLLVTPGQSLLLAVLVANDGPERGEALIGPEFILWARPDGSVPGQSEFWAEVRTEQDVVAHMKFSVLTEDPVAIEADHGNIRIGRARDVLSNPWWNGRRVDWASDPIEDLMAWTRDDLRIAPDDDSAVVLLIPLHVRLLPRPVTDPGLVPLNRLKAEQCFDWMNGYGHDPVRPVPCSVAHHAEVFATPTHPDPVGAPFPAPHRRGEWLCEGPYYQAYVGASYRRSRLWADAIFPDVFAWNAGRRDVTCFLFEIGEKSEGSALGSERSIGAQEES